MTKINVILISGGLSAIVILAIGAFYFWQSNTPAGKQQVTSPSTSLTTTRVPTKEVTVATVTQTPKLGTVEGSLSFPSEFIPENMKVCAETLMGVQFECTSKHIKDSKYTYGVGYRLELPPGNYYVYAQTPDFRADYKAYYSGFVTCGLSVNCTSHEPIKVNVSEGTTISNVDPQDWYAQ